MSVAKVIEISSTSPESFEDAVKQGLARANTTIKGIHSAWIKEQRCTVQDGKVKDYLVHMLVTFVLND